MSSRLQRDEAIEKEDRIDEIKKKNNQPTHPAPSACTAGPCSTICQSSRTPRHWKLPSTIARPNLQTTIKDSYIVNKSIKETFFIFFSAKSNFISHEHQKFYFHSYCFWCSFSEIKFDLTLKRNQISSVYPIGTLCMLVI